MTGADVTTTSGELLLRVREGREIMLPSGELVDVIRDPAKIADLRDELEEQITAARAFLAALDRAVLEVFDGALVTELELDDGRGRLAVDPPGKVGKIEWNDQQLAKLRELAPADPDLADLYNRALADALRPEYVYKPLKRKLDAIGEANPAAAAIIAEAISRRPAARSVRVDRRHT